MGGKTERPLSVAEAKAQLRQKAEEAMPSGYVRRHPLTVLALAFAAGYFLGGTGSSRELATRAMLKVL